MMFVGPGWMNKMGRWEQPYELLLQVLQQTAVHYYGKLKKEGKFSRYDDVRVRRLLPREEGRGCWQLQ